MYQKIVIIGHLGQDPEMRYTPDGKSVTNFSVAVNHKEETTWFRVSAWGKLAEICEQYLSKGRMVLVEGRLKSDPNTGGPSIWKGKSGPRASFEIIAQTVTFLGGREEPFESVTEDIPF